MRKKVFLTIAVLMLIIAAALSGCSSEGSSIRITPEEAMYMMSNQDVIILDVRSLDEFNTGYIPGAVSLPVNEIRYAAIFMIPDVEQTILIYCRSGVRSAEAADILIDMGYRNVFDFGGILDWTGEIQH